jgi:hypothetical protein
MKRYLMLIGRIIIVKMGVGKSGRVGVGSGDLLLETGDGGKRCGMWNSWRMDWEGDKVWTVKKD